MLYTLKTVGTKTEVHLKGNFNFSDYNTFREVIKSLEEQEITYCIFNLSEVDFIDSAGLGMLLIARDMLAQKNVQVVLQGAHTQVKKMLELGRFENLFTIE